MFTFRFLPRQTAAVPRIRRVARFSLLFLLIGGSALRADAPAVPNPLTDPNQFPIAVWSQGPHQAERYKAIGVNLYVALWNGPTAEQLAALKAAGMAVICDQNEVALTDPNRDIIVAWMHGDEPDNAQSLGEGKGYGPPIPPEEIIAGYEKIKARESTRPVLLNLSQGVAWDGWYGRGTRTNHPEDYPEYVKGADIVSFDIYPVTHDRPELAGKLELVPFGLDRLKTWAGRNQDLWTCIECTRISNPDVKPTPAQVRSMVWMALIHGAKGLIYFCHQFQPNFIEAALLADPEMAKGVGAINHRIQALAPVLKSPDVPAAAKVSVSNPEVPVDILVKKFGGDLYVFAANMRDQPNSATFEIPERARGKGEVLDESREIKLEGHRFTDAFEPYGVHLYRISLAE